MALSTEKHSQAAIAIVGISTELPSGTHSPSNLDLFAFQELLFNKKDAYESFPCNRLDIKSWKGNALGQIKTGTGTFLKDISMFDNLEFGVSAKDARAMAVGTRKLLEQSFLALLDSGIDYRGRNIGCYMSAVDFEINNIAEPDEFEAKGSFAGLPCMVANRISYHLDLQGPSIPVDTACSSSLTATHLAIQAIRNGECEAAIVGGCQINLRLMDWINYSQGNLLAADGRCKPFDESADGFGRGEGAIVIVLKLLSEAIRDGDHIYASIIGTGINASGCAAPPSAPVAEAQRDAMIKAYSVAGRSPTEVDFIELHATGTAVGDPTESNWVGEEFQRDGELLIGSVKGNLGHLEITAFLASLVKTCFIFKSGMIPPNVNFYNPNPAIKWKQYKLRVVTELTPLHPRHDSGRALVSITSSGIGGSNGHAVIEAPPKFQITDGGTLGSKMADRIPILVLAGGLTPRSASANAQMLVDTVSTTHASDLPKLSVILGRRAWQMTWRTFAVVTPDQQLDVASFSSPRLVPRSRPPLVFVFSGQGPQHIDMGRQLFASCSAFRESILCLDQVYEEIVGQSLTKTTGLFDSFPVANDLHATWPISIVLPAIAMVQIALVDLLRSVNITPDIVLGHSAGETVVLYASGATSKEIALSIAIARGRAMSILEEAGGTMAALSCSPTDAQAIIDSITNGGATGKVEIACFNASEAVTISGLEHSVTKAVDTAKERGHFATILRTRVPVHSSMMDVCKQRYEALMREIFEADPGNHRPTVTTYSTLTGRAWNEPFTPEYFWKNARSPVQFAEAVSSLLRKFPHATFVEISPHPVLSAYITNLGGKHISTFCPMRRSKSSDGYQELKVLNDCIGQLVCVGFGNIDLAAFYNVRVADPKCVSLPPYSLARKHIPYYPEYSELTKRQLVGSNGPLKVRHLKMNSATHPDIAQHVIKGEPIMPAAGYLEMMFERGARQLWDIDFHSMFSFSATYPTLLYVELNRVHWSVGSYLDVNDTTKGYRLHAEGYSCESNAVEGSNPNVIHLSSIKQRCTKEDISGFYKSLEYFATYGPYYQRVTDCYKGQDEALVRVRGMTNDIKSHWGYIFHPAVLDACFHVAVHRMMTQNFDNNDYYLPSHIHHIVLSEILIKSGVPDVLYVHTVFSHWNPDHLVFDFTIADEHGMVLCSLSGFEIARHKSVPDHKIQHCFDMVDQTLCKELSVTEMAQDGGRSSLHAFQFVRGKEMELKQKLREIDENESSVVWIYADTCSHGAAARGFSRSLRREILTWDIRLVILPREWNVTQKHSAICQLALSGISEEEVSIGLDGKISVPRITESATPQEVQRLFDDSIPWYLNNRNQIVQTPPFSVPDNHALVSIESTSGPGLSLQGFIGHITKGKYLGSRVWGIMLAEPLSNYAVLHEGRFVLIEDGSNISPCLSLGALAASLAIGAHTVTKPSRLNGRKILVTNASSSVGCALLQILTVLGIKHDSVDEGGLLPIGNLSSYDIIISGFAQEEDVQVLKCATRPDSTIFFWNDSVRGIRAVFDREMWAVADALDLIKRLDTHNDAFGHRILPIQVLETRIDITSVEVICPLFNPEKTYLLVGGIGSLGMGIAVWMYKNGARHIVMTSRNGDRSPSLIRNQKAMRMHNYLRDISDLTLRLDACDATSISEMKKMISTIEGPIGGCMILSVVLSDRSFFAHNTETYTVPFAPKVLAFETLTEVIAIKELDFLITFSSGAIFGNAGQTNYSSSNTLLDELTREYPNAFSIVTPVILDSTVVIDTVSSKLRNYLPWGVTSEHLCSYIEDGLRKLKNGPFWLYIPDLNWNIVHDSFGPSCLYNHLASKMDESDPVVSETPTLSLRDIISGLLDIRDEDLSPDVPLTSYGLDSVSAARLSFELRPMMSITQLQLLANVTLTDLELRLGSYSKEEMHTSKNRDESNFNWVHLNKSGESIVKLRDLDGVPLILIHGASGNIVGFRPLQQLFSTSLWAIQATPETPTQSIGTIAKFYFGQIKKERPNGPYRIGGFSGTSLITLELVHLLEAHGDQVVQLAFLDHSPMLFCSPMWTWDDITISQGAPSHQMIAHQTSVLCTAIRSVNRHNVADGLMDALNGKGVLPHIKDYHETFKALIALIVSYLLGIAAEKSTRLEDALGKRVQDIKAPITVYVASNGIINALPVDERPAWADFGASAMDANVITVQGDHYEFMESSLFIQDIQYSWQMPLE